MRLKFYLNIFIATIL